MAKKKRYYRPNTEIDNFRRQKRENDQHLYILTHGYGLNGLYAKIGNMEKSVIGAGPIVTAMPSTTINRVNAAISSLKNLISTGRFDPVSTAKLQTHLANSQALQRQLSVPVANPRLMKAAIGDDGDDGDGSPVPDSAQPNVQPAIDDSDEATLSDIESAITTAATVYQTVTSKPAPIVVVPGSRINISPPGSTILGIPAPIAIIGGLGLTALLIYAITD